MPIVQVKRAGSAMTPAAQARADRKAENERVKAAVRQTHPLYDRWIQDWRELGWLYEGDGPYRDGTALIAHPRELEYRRDAEGNITSYDQIIGETQKYKRRRQLASYENLTEVIIDTVSDHQYALGIKRTAGGVAQRRRGDGSDSSNPVNAYFEWLEDVDGLGTHMDDWLHDQQILANLYGHVVVVMDRLPALNGGTPRSKAEQGPQVLRAYIPPDALDWLHYYGRLTSVKVVDPVERKDIMDPHVRPARTTATSALLQGGGTTEQAEGVEFRIFRPGGWELYDINGRRKAGAPYDYGRAPISTFYSKRRARIPVIGRSFLKSPSPYRDNYNLLSEFRELLRANTFGLLTIGLAESESVEDAKKRLGKVISTETVLFSYGPVTYAAPPDSPARLYLDALERNERKAYRQAGLPYEGDSRDVEAAESRRIKSMDLNKALGGMADEAERLEYDIARLWYAGEYGAVNGRARFTEAQIVIQHPDEFFVQQVSEAAEDAKLALELKLGKTANTRIRQQFVPVILRNLPEDDKKAIDKEIAELSEKEAEQAEKMAQVEVLPLTEAGEPEGGDRGGAGGAGAVGSGQRKPQPPVGGRRNAGA